MELINRHPYPERTQERHAKLIIASGWYPSHPRCSLALFCMGCFPLPEKTYSATASIRENQAGFRPARGCIDHIFTLRQILEQRHCFQQPTMVVFLDLKAAFDSVDRQALWQCLWSKGVPHKFLNLIKALYANSRDRVKVQEKLSPEFTTSSGLARAMRSSLPPPPIIGERNCGSYNQCATSTRFLQLTMMMMTASNVPPELCFRPYRLSDTLMSGNHRRPFQIYIHYGGSVRNPEGMSIWQAFA
ncbi:hypothetical protein T265_04657 [Opisthorchis viverrini]|uniref:Reverse transcriptase domain-containing protein n=1 Tax=Opisthorchis viverrini TaxID=6198 RepID=A0A075AG92_OPIVI|nr:hypothetical protein T265_04657 [Opisthorchis viverrini]KER28519.1 hypothetical protein T265_04657 [Opisthorchis viverrini]